MSLQNGTPIKTFVTIKSSDKGVNDLVKRIGKSFHLEIWATKALALLDAYLTNLDLLDALTDKVEIGKKIQENESYIISAVTYLMRCFSDQPSTHLRVADYIKDIDLLECYRNLEKLRNDEFVHWKGMNSSIEATFSFERIDESHVNFAELVSANLKDTFGPWDEIDTVKKFIGETVSHISTQRLKYVAQLRQHLAKPEVIKSTDIFDEKGDQLIRK